MGVAQDQGPWTMTEIVQIQKELWVPRFSRVESLRNLLSCQCGPFLQKWPFKVMGRKDISKSVSKNHGNHSQGKWGPNQGTCLLPQKGVLIGGISEFLRLPVLLFQHLPRNCFSGACFWWLLYLINMFVYVRARARACACVCVITCLFSSHVSIMLVPWNGPWQELLHYRHRQWYKSGLFSC